MAILGAFPADKNLWLVRWIDEVRLAQSDSVSSTVSVLIEKLNFSTEQVMRFSADEVATLLSQSRPEQKPAEGAILIAEDGTEIINVLTGYLPGLAVGQIYLSGKLVCELPSSRNSIVLEDGENSGQDVCVRENITAQNWWGPKYTHPAMASYEYKLHNNFLKSRVFTFEDGDRIYIFPRATIFRSFFGCHSELAKAFTSGNYNDAMKRLVHFEPLKNGLVTGIFDNEWHVILNRLVLDDYARQVAILLFDPYARKCAEELYSKTLQQRFESSGGSYFTAKIPFTGKLRLNIKGYELIQPKAERRLKRFLVTAIIGTTVPEYIPKIKFERYNSGNVGDEIIENLDKIAYQDKSEATPTPSELNLISNDDADLNAEKFCHDVLSFAFIDVTPLEKIKKQSSQKFLRASRIKNKSTNGKGSSGEAGGGKSGTSLTGVGTLFRKPVRIFNALSSVLETLQAEKIIDTFNTMQPDEPSQREDRGGLVGWNFLDENTRKTGNWPARGWSIVRKHPRAVLLIEITAGNNRGIWVEIESREIEAFRSPFIWSKTEGLDIDLGLAVDVIAKNKGRNLQKKLRSTFSFSKASFSAYTHSYIKNGISVRSVYNFLFKLKFVSKELKSEKNNPVENIN